MEGLSEDGNLEISHGRFIFSNEWVIVFVVGVVALILGVIVELWG